MSISYRFATDFPLILEPLEPPKVWFQHWKTIRFAKPRFRGKVVFWINPRIVCGMLLVTFTCNSWIPFWHCFWDTFLHALVATVQRKRPGNHLPNDPGFLWWRPMWLLGSTSDTLVSSFGSLAPPRMIVHCSLVDFGRIDKEVLLSFHGFPFTVRASAATALATFLYRLQ